jgi:hypothetical protein
MAEHFGRVDERNIEELLEFHGLITKENDSEKSPK